MCQYSVSECKEATRPEITDLLPNKHHRERQCFIQCAQMTPKKFNMMNVPYMTCITNAQGSISAETIRMVWPYWSKWPSVLCLRHTKTLGGKKHHKHPFLSLSCLLSLSLSEWRLMRMQCVHLPGWDPAGGRCSSRVNGGSSSLTGPLLLSVLTHWNQESESLALRSHSWTP